MTPYILIFWWIGADIPATTIEFNSPAACEAAAAEIEARSFGSITVFCVAKG